MHKLQTTKKPNQLEARLAKLVYFKERKTLSWIGRPERFHHNHVIDMNGYAAKYELF